MGHDHRSGVLFEGGNNKRCTSHLAAELAVLLEKEEMMEIRLATPHSAGDRGWGLSPPQDYKGNFETDCFDSRSITHYISMSRFNQFTEKSGLAPSSAYS